MANISDSEGLEAWLNGKSPELAGVLAARAAEIRNVARSGGRRLESTVGEASQRFSLDSTQA